MLIIKLGYREIVANWKWTITFLTSLTLGLFGFILVQIFSSGLESYLKKNAKEILGADITVGARRQLTRETFALIQKSLPAGTNYTWTYEFFAMVRHDGQSHLVSILAVENEYPLYGSLQLVDTNNHKNIQIENLPSDSVLVYQELNELLNLKTDSKLEIGAMRFSISGTVRDNRIGSFRLSSIAPRIFIHLKSVEKTKLIQFGSTYTHRLLIKLPKGANPSELSEKISAILPDPTIEIETIDGEVGGAGRSTKLVTDYIGLMSIIGLFFSFLGSIYLFRSYLQTKIKDIAVLRTLGMRSYQIISLYLFITCSLCIFAFLCSSVVASLSLPYLTSLLFDNVSQDKTFDVPISSYLILLAFSCALGILVSLPIIFRANILSIQNLFSKTGSDLNFGSQRAQYFFASVFLMIFSTWHSHSFWTGSLFTIVILANSALLVSLIYFFLTKIYMEHWHWEWRYSLISARFNISKTILSGISISMGTMLIVLIPTLKVSVKDQFSLGVGTKYPNLFLFDIQDEQLNTLRQSLQDMGLTNNFSFPMVRSRILKHNGKDFERASIKDEFVTREKERDTRFRNRGVNLSYRNTLTSSERVTAGRFFTDTSRSVDGAPAEISLEESYAARLNIEIGDILEFDVQGVPILGKVIGFRQVNWLSFQPNFFILFQPGVLEDAPKTHLLSIFNAESPIEVQNRIANQFPNVSTINVERIFKELLNFSERIAWAIQVLALLSMVTGYFVLVSILVTHTTSRKYEVSLLKVLGSSERSIINYLTFEIGVVTFIASSIGSILGMFVSYVIATRLLKVSFSWELHWLIFGIAITTVFSFLLAFVFSKKISNESALKLLRSKK